MKISRAKFVILFLVLGFAFQFISNSLLGTEVRLFPINGDPFPGLGSPIVGKSTASVIIFPIKYVLLAPVLSLFKLPDPPPPLLVLVVALYWSVIALILYYILNKIWTRKKIVS